MLRKNNYNIKVSCDIKNNIPVAVPSLYSISTVILVIDGLLRTSTGCTDPLSSLTLYVD